LVCLVGVFSLGPVVLLLQGYLAARRVERGVLALAKVVKVERTVSDGKPLGDDWYDVQVRYEVDGREVIGTLEWTSLDDDELASLQPGATVTIRYDPTKPSECEAESLTTVHGEAHSFGPMWLLGSLGAQTWLLPRGPQRKTWYVFDFSDPHRAETKPPRPRVHAVAPLVSEWIWMHTDVALHSAVLVKNDKSGVLRSCGPLNDYESLAGPYLKKPDYGGMVWGAATADLDTEGFTMRVRAAHRSSEHTFEGTVDTLCEKLVAFLVEQGACARRDPPPWFARPTDPEKLSRYAALLEALLVQCLAAEAPGVFPPLEPDAHTKAVEEAFDALGGGAAAGEQVKLAVIAIAGYAHRAGALSESRRANTLALVDGLQHDDLRKLAPRFLRELGADRAQASDASVAYRTAGVSEDDAYGTWLRKVGQ
jgi:hypothetical protein